MTPNPLRVGRPALVSVTADDSTTGNSPITSAQYRINTGRWQALLPADGQWGSVTETAQKSLTFSSAGDYTICVRARDGAGNTSTESCSLVTVFNPASTVTGNGQFTSPKSAIASTPNHTGRATFSIQASYPSAQATTPTGTFTLQLTGTAFTFQSTSLQTLLTTSGGVGELRGTGKLNGQSGYAFSVSFDDNGTGTGTGTQDRIRIRIWNTGTNAVVYDSQPGQATTASPTIRLTSGNLSVTP